MVPEAKLEDDGAGLVPKSVGWFVLNARAARWFDKPAQGHSVPLTGYDEYEAENFFPMYPELTIPPDQWLSFKETRSGCVLGAKLAKKFNWKVGDKFFLESFIPPYRKRSGPFEFVVSGIYDADLAKYPGTDVSSMYFHYDYLKEGVGREIGVGTYAV